MKNYISISLTLILLISTVVHGQVEKREKIAQTGMKFLNVSVDAGVSALAGAGTSVELNSSSVFYNPAALGYLSSFASISLGRVNWIADIDYSFISAAINPKGGRFGTIGLFAIAVDYGEFRGTIRDSGEQGFIDIGLFSPSAYTIGVCYAKALSTLFSVGGNVKFVKQDLGSSIIGFDSESTYKEKQYHQDVVAFDFGVICRTGFKSLNFGMCVRNFSREIKYEDESFQLPLIFKIGLSMNVLDIFERINKDHQSLFVTMDAIHPRDFPEQINVGVEYLLFKTMALRIGYSTPNDEHDISTGFGLRRSYKNYMLALDYAYTPFGIFNNVHRFSMHISL